MNGQVFTTAKMAEGGKRECAGCGTHRPLPAGVQARSSHRGGVGQAGPGRAGQAKLAAHSLHSDGEEFLLRSG